MTSLRDKILPLLESGRFPAIAYKVTLGEVYEFAKACAALSPAPEMPEEPMIVQLWRAAKDPSLVTPVARESIVYIDKLLSYGIVEHARADKFLKDYNKATELIGDAAQKWEDRAIAAESDRERLRLEVDRETAIVDRIWDQLGRPTYEQLAGRSIYDLIDELKALAARAEHANAGKDGA